MNPAKKVILVYPVQVPMGPHIPTGLAYIARALELAGVSYEVVDLNLDSLKYLMFWIGASRPQFLGISVWSYRCQETYRLLHRIKEAFPQLAIIAGGPHVTSGRELVLAECPAIDVGVVGEGEAAIVEVVRGDSLPAVKGIVYRHEGRARFTGVRPFADLDDIPFPTFAGFKLEKYGPRMLLVSSRGCPYKCIFCSIPRICGKGWRSRSVESMLEEIRHWHERGYHLFRFSDSNFALNRTRLWRFCDQVVQEDLRCTFEARGVRADHLDRELMQQMRRAGFTRLCMGVESGSNRVLRTLKKGETREQIEATIAAAVDMGFDMVLYFLIGSPGEGPQDVRQSFELARKYPVAQVLFSSLSPYRGTEFFDWAVANGYWSEMHCTDDEDRRDVARLRTDAMSIDQLNHFLAIGHRIEREVAYRFRMRRLLCRSRLTKALAHDRLLSILCWVVSHDRVRNFVRATPLKRLGGAW